MPAGKPNSPDWGNLAARASVTGGIATANPLPRKSTHKELDRAPGAATTAPRSPLRPQTQRGPPSLGEARGL